MQFYHLRSNHYGHQFMIIFVALSGPFLQFFRKIVTTCVYSSSLFLKTLTFSYFRHSLVLSNYATLFCYDFYLLAQVKCYCMICCCQLLLLLTQHRLLPSYDTAHTHHIGINSPILLARCHSLCP